MIKRLQRGASMRLRNEIVKPVKPKFSATRAYGNNRYIVYSPKLNRDLIVYSNLEYQCFLLLEFDSNVSFYCEQPDLNISYSINGNIRKSIVDFLKKDSAGITIIECKPSIELEKKEVIEQIHIQKEWAILQDFSHEVFTEKLLGEKQNMIENLKMLHTALIQYSVQEHYFVRESVLFFLKENKNSSIQHLLNYCPNISERTVFPILAKLFHEGKITILISSKIGLETEVSINNEK
ncbi:TnsA endonuclease N-terminal domain-containing protein [Streptococcus hyovaginalis]|uniref:TnsA endonuclease N-terminal domain-containing protein n=1 Tax=Streptococcus hyovaginalis TaxID=149015 RepID=UPI001FDED49B|nr:TnsA endonuclease N-terminal domain-containing protein [Streptococcus hyovaginalis]